MNTTPLHEKALGLATQYKSSESALLDVLIQMQDNNEFLLLGYRHLYDYAFRALGLSEAQSAYFSKVAEKSKEVPELKKAVEEGKLSLSKARRIVPVITQENAKNWIEKASTLPQRQLEKAVTAENPKALVKERIRPLTPHHSELRVTISSSLEEKLKRAQDLIAQKGSVSPSLEATLEKALDQFLEKHDPIQKAKRASSRKPTPTPKPTANHRRYPAPLRHAIFLRDQAQCTHLYPNGKRCDERRYLHVHHKIPLSHGGTSILSNLTTLCSRHHAGLHLP